MPMIRMALPVDTQSQTAHRRGGGLLRWSALYTPLEFPLKERETAQSMGDDRGIIKETKQNKKNQSISVKMDTHNLS